jgi:Protein of unknown function (DUF1214)
MAPIESVGRAWERFTTRLGEMGNELLGPEFPGTERDRIDGYRYLGRLASLAWSWAVEFSDPRYPGFLRHDDDVHKWGGPNVDNTYIRASVRAPLRYRVYGNVRGPHGFVISTHEGDMQLGQYGVYAEMWHDELTVDDDGTFELIVSPQRPDGARNWMPLHELATNLTIRQYYADWTTDVPAELHIECLDTVGVPRPNLGAAELAAGIDAATNWAGISLHYWNQYMADAAAATGENTVRAPRGAPGGAKDIAYGSGFARLSADQAMIIEGEAPDAWAWNYMLYNMGWMESFDFVNRTTSITGSQMHIDDDGRFRLVVSERDPGVANWLDTTGAAEVMIAYRYIRTHTQPVPSAQVVPFGEVASVLAGRGGPGGAAERARQITERQRHVARRFRR